MKYIRLSYLKKEHGFLKDGYISLTGSTGKLYNSRVLLVPEYGWIPCSMRLRTNFTCDHEKLTLVIEEHSDPQKSVTSNMWVTLNNIEKTMGRELLKPTRPIRTSLQKSNDCDEMDLPF